MTLNESKQILAAQAAIKSKGVTEKYKKRLPYLADDIESAANWGAVRAAATYSSEGGDSWERWSKRIIKFSIHETIQQECVRDANRIHFMDVKQPLVSDDKAHCEDEPTDGKLVVALLETLDGRERMVCDLVYKQGQSLIEAAQLMGIGRPYATKLHQRALAKLKFAMPD